MTTRHPRLEAGSEGQQGTVTPAPTGTLTAAASAPLPAADTAPVRLASSQPIELTAEGRRERHRRETFERLVRAAREIMFNRGFNDITVQDITDAADVGKGTFFNYFRSKEHIVTRVQEYNRKGLVRAVEQVRSGERSPQEALTEILLWLLCPTGGDWLTYQSNTMRALALHADVRQYFSPELRSNFDTYVELMQSAQQQAKVRADVSPADLGMITQTFFAGLTVLYWIHGTAPTPPLLTDVIDKYFTLISPPAVPTRPPARTRKAPARRRPPAKRVSGGKSRRGRPAAATRRR